jgi:hypothetical protein
MEHNGPQGEDETKRLAAIPDRQPPSVKELIKLTLLIGAILAVLAIIIPFTLHCVIEMVEFGWDSAPSAAGS